MSRPSPVEEAVRQTFRTESPVHLSHLPLELPGMEADTRNMNTNEALSPLQYEAKTDMKATVRTRLAQTAGNLGLLAFRINDGNAFSAVQVLGNQRRSR